jgi:hypothetical protein
MYQKCQVYRRAYNPPGKRKKYHKERRQGKRAEKRERRPGIRGIIYAPISSGATDERKRSFCELRHGCDDVFRSRIAIVGEAAFYSTFGRYPTDWNYDDTHGVQIYSDAGQKPAATILPSEIEAESARNGPELFADMESLWRTKLEGVVASDSRTKCRVVDGKS